MVLPKPNPTKAYWIEAAESPLRDYQSSETLPEETDVAIIGSGYAGVSTAYWLHKYTEHASKQPRVTILEARDVCGAATGRNGGQLRPHLYSRYPIWRDRFGAAGAMHLIRHEHAHLAAFKELCDAEGITEEVCLKLGETFDAAMTDEAWARLSHALDEMRKDYGDENEIVKICRKIEDQAEVEDVTQMKGALKAIVHPTGQIWPYKFIHALVRILLATPNLTLYSHTPVTSVSERDPTGYITVTTPRGTLRAKTVVHATCRWASHLLPEFERLILPQLGAIAAIKAPPGLLKRTGAQQWDGMINNYHVQLPPPYNVIIIGGARQLLTHYPEISILNDEDDKQAPGVADFYKTWPAADIVDWPGPKIAELGFDVEKGGSWTGAHETSADGFPFVGALPSRSNQFINAGYTGHGMPRILLSSASLAPLVLDALGLQYSPPQLAASYPALPQPFHATEHRIAKLQDTDPEKVLADYRVQCEASARKPFCNIDRVKGIQSSPHL
ncbi:FAD dependent oxidoreductase-domain-containing protein [Bipolaris maydis]|nr:FAD dependent oxidoreductase-domain-containing protein [Bipolaris maydis]KAJ6197772.1 FAD dependent oxidoreductase-domain-containing protein [Bipolaris maydis]KAJ6282194.1 FAD dependent oxidoreductase-domain-containing protein [Bipolaris maydis]